MNDTTTVIRKWIAVLLLPLTKALLGERGALPALLLVLAAPVHGMFYFRAKLRADDHFSGEGQP